MFLTTCINDADRKGKIPIWMTANGTSQIKKSVGTLMDKALDQLLIHAAKGAVQ